MQVLAAKLHVGLAAVDCTGNETSLLQCTSNNYNIHDCSRPDINTTDVTVLACANTAGPLSLWHECRQSCPNLPVHSLLWPVCVPRASVPSPLLVLPYQHSAISPLHPAA